MSARFAAVLATLEAHEAEFWGFAKLLESAFSEATRAFWKAANGRRKFDASKARDLPGYADMHAKWQAVADEMVAARKARTEALETELKALANDPLPVGVAFTVGFHVYGGAYRSQGYGARKYALGDAQMYADKAAHYGLVTCIASGDYDGIDVYVNTDSVGVAMLARRDDVPLRDWVAGCLKRGTSPRVYMPFLPWNYESLLGVDGFGNFVEPEGKAA